MCVCVCVCVCVHMYKHIYIYIYIYIYMYIHAYNSVDMRTRTLVCIHTKIQPLNAHTHYQRTCTLIHTINALARSHGVHAQTITQVLGDIRAHGPLAVRPIFFFLKFYIYCPFAPLCARTSRGQALRLCLCLCLCLCL